ncbi:glycoside hydrolase family 2 TIM barrel-domain containing protein [Ancylobacter mangrovi]|uniref:glycoside hydrolase family 2 TIM barrel-domain containing protein n=1 Tax=Ancylobacter mangrovi TaxID=2972472 RepID=UPI0021634355|nr:glycoside hydrolase family 2 TIM barrel-domain containing protein [Ancylobacter mangrovi]MCS0502124.1 glycosyl hydrolase [Ancylobacter mangrovi]
MSGTRRRHGTRRARIARTTAFALIAFLAAPLTLPMTAASAAEAAKSATAREVTVAGERILVDGKPFAVRGATGDGPLGELAALGATTVRTYGGDPGPVLDAAEAAGLKVIVGLWVGQPRKGADYGDPAFVARQLNELRATVQRYRDHPALLMWGIGNEVEVDLPAGGDGAVWPAIEQVAAMVKRTDPAHPTMAVLAETGTDKVARLRAQAPSIDVLGLNSYGDALYTAPARARDQGWTGPIVITELGALGQWQAATTPWGAPFEPSSTQKAIQIRRYLKALGEQKAGTILFLWGQKQEVTPSWHSLRLAGGEWLEASEAMADAWGGQTPGGNHAPRIAWLRVDGDPSAPFASWPADAPGSVRLNAVDPDGDPLTATWRVMAESTARGIGGDAEAVPPVFPQAIQDGGLDGATITPLPPGHYRIFVELRDGRGAGATANLPFELR